MSKSNLLNNDKYILEAWVVENADLLRKHDIRATDCTLNVNDKSYSISATFSPKPGMVASKELLLIEMTGIVADEYRYRGAVRTIRNLWVRFRKLVNDYPPIDISYLEDILNQITDLVYAFEVPYDEYQSEESDD